MTNHQTTKQVDKVEEVIDAMRSIVTENDRWNLAERLAKLIPTGTTGFLDIVDKAKAEGVDGGLTTTTLRLYRDTANRWPSDKRVPNVSFSAHREAMVLPSIADAAKMLGDLQTNLGSGKVTVASVRKAIAVKNGKVPAAPRKTAAAQAQAKTMVDQRDDLRHGGKKLIASIGPSTSSTELDELHAGLTKVIAHVERLRSKAARKNAAAKAPAAKRAGANGAPAKKAPVRKAQGDLRGL